MEALNTRRSSDSRQWGQFPSLLEMKHIQRMLTIPLIKRRVEWTEKLCYHSWIQESWTLVVSDHSDHLSKKVGVFCYWFAVKGKMEQGNTVNRLTDNRYLCFQEFSWRLSTIQGFQNSIVTQLSLQGNPVTGDWVSGTVGWTHQISSESAHISFPFWCWWQPCLESRLCVSIRSHTLWGISHSASVTFLLQRPTGHSSRGLSCR